MSFEYYRARPTKFTSDEHPMDTRYPSNDGFTSTQHPMDSD